MKLERSRAAVFTKARKGLLFYEKVLLRYNEGMYYVYILQSKKDHSYYTGYATDLKQRIKHHNGHASKYSSAKAPFDLVWYCAFKDEKKAIVFEKYLKIGSGFAFARKHLV